MIDLDEEYIEGLYEDELTKTIIRCLSDNDLTDYDRIKFLVEYMEAKGIE